MCSSGSGHLNRLRAHGEARATDPQGRVKFLRLAWDAVGSEFAGRHTQYEMFHAGARFVTGGHSYRTYDWRAATGLVDEILDRYDVAASMGGGSGADPDRSGR